MTSRSTSSRIPRRLATAALAAVMALTAGCGTRLEDAEIVGAMSPAGTSADSAGAGTAGAPVVAGTGTDPLAPGTPAAPAAANPTTAAGQPAAPTSGQPGATAPDRAAKPGADVATGGVRAADRSTLVFGNLGSYSGLMGALELGNKQALGAWVAWQNARGGLDGHPIKVIYGDDQADPATGLSLLKRMVERDNVMAFVANVNAFGFDQYADYAKSKGVPFIGGDAVDPRWFTDPNAFPSSSPLHVQIEKGLQYFLNSGSTKLGMLYCLEIAKLCSYLNEMALKSSVGKNIVVSEQVSLVAPSYTSQCLRMQSAKVEVVFLLMDTAGAARFAQNCSTQGYKPKIMLLGLDASPTFPDVEVLKDAYVPGATVAPSEMQLPSIKDYREAMTKYAPGVRDSGFGMLGWAGGVILGKAGAKLSDQPTVQELLQNLWKIKNETFGGLTVPLTFSKDKPASPSSCVFVWGVKDKRFFAPDGFKPIC